MGKDHDYTPTGAGYGIGNPRNPFRADGEPKVPHCPFNEVVVGEPEKPNTPNDSPREKRKRGQEPSAF